MRLSRNLLFATTIMAGVQSAGLAMAQTTPPVPPTVLQPDARAAEGAKTATPDNGVTTSAGAAAAIPSPQQTSSTAAQASGTVAGVEVTGVTVTGSRLRNTEFTSADPIQVITGEEASLRGFSDTAALIQSSTVAGNGTQINNNFTGFVVNGGPGVNTVALRGLGTDRTLVLLNGKRLGPAGTQGQVSSVDLNTIPESIIDHIDILKDGSSSVYGSDAVAGIVNLVTKQNIDGGDLHVYGKPTVEGGGNQADISGDFGKTFGRGYINGSFDIYRQDALKDFQRNYFNCAQDFAYDPTSGQRLDLTNVATGKIKCQNILGGLVIDGNTGSRYIVTPSSGNSINAPAGLTRVDCTIYNSGSCTNDGSGINLAATRLSRSLQPTEDNPAYLNSNAVSPVRRYTATLSGGYDILPKYLTVYGDFLFNRRQSQQEGYRQVFTYLDPANPTNPVGNASPLGIAQAGSGDYGEPVVLTPFGSKQQVDYTRGLVGLRGDLPDFRNFKNWHYDLSAQFSKSDGTYSTDIIYADRFSATTGPTACDVNYQNPYVSGPTMATQEPGVACQPVNWTRATQADGFTAAEKAFLTGNDTGSTIYEQGYVEGDFTGDLFTLPAGAVSADVGFHVRRDRILDTPGAQSLAGNSWGLASSGITRGGENVQEGFAEIGIPILRDLPFAKSVSLDVSGRYSHYDLAGDAKTYKAKFNWKITSWLALKYDQGTSFRGPALYETFLANQQGYYGQLGVDPCIMYAGSANANVAAHCAAQGIPGDYAGNGPSILVTSGGGGRALKPETSFAKNMGVVLTPRFMGNEVGIEVDYYENTIHNTITQFGPSNIVNQCYSLPTFPNGYCNLFQRNLTPGTPDLFSITAIQNNYLNVGSLHDRGIDLTIRSSFKLPYDVKLRVSSQHSWTIQDTTELLPGTVTNYNGTVGSPNYVGNIDLRFDWQTWTLNWFTSFVGASSDLKLASNIIENYRGTGVTAEVVERYPFYNVSNLSIRKTFPEGLTIEAGILNVFDRPPPIYSDLGFATAGGNGVTGSSAVSSQYDFFGRSFFLQLDKKF